MASLPNRWKRFFICRFRLFVLSLPDQLLLPMTYDVFISYARGDYADKNKQVIPNNAISRIKALFDEHNITYWFDEEGVFSGDAFAPMIARNIKASKIFLFISTERSNSSEWTSNEIATAHTYRKKIIPFRYDDSVYNDSVIIYIARLDYIDYQANPEKAFDRLLHSVQSYLQVEREKAEREQQEEARRREAEISRKERAAKLQSLRERIEHLENRKFEIEKEILTQEKTLTDLRNEKRIVEANISDLQEEEALLLGHTRPKQPVVETPHRVESATKRKEPVAESGERKGLFAREWADLKAAMAQKHWLVNTIVMLWGVFAFVICAWLFLWFLDEVRTYTTGTPIAAFAMVLGCYRLLKNRRDGWYWMLFGSVMGVLFIENKFDARIMMGIMATLACGVFALAMLIRKHGKSAWSHLQRNTLPIKRDKIYLSQIVVAGLFLLLCLGNWIDTAMMKRDVERRFENGATWSELKEDVWKVMYLHPFVQWDWYDSLRARDQAREVPKTALDDNSRISNLPN
ncbi:MAG: TIR domain-containing protein [Alistipes sp.]|nr:TIR domain-containing protein [Alistipes sp.]